MAGPSAPPRSRAADASGSPHRPHASTSCLQCLPIQLCGCDHIRASQHLRRIYIGPLPMSLGRAKRFAKSLVADEQEAERRAARRAQATSDQDLALAPSETQSNTNLTDVEKSDIAKGRTSTEGKQQKDDQPQPEQVQAIASVQPSSPVQFRWKKSFAVGQKPDDYSSSNDTAYASSSVTAPARSAPSGEAVAGSRPRQTLRDSSNASLASAVSFASAQSLPRSVFSESEAGARIANEEGRTSQRPLLQAILPPRSPDRPLRRLFRRQTSEAGGQVPAIVANQGAPETIEQGSSRAVSAPTPSDRTIRRIVSLGSVQNRDFDAASKRLPGRTAFLSVPANRTRSASADGDSRSNVDAARGSAHAGGIRAGHHVWESSHGRLKPLPLLNLPVTEADESGPFLQDEGFPDGTAEVPSYDSAFLAPSSTTSHRRPSFDESVDPQPRSSRGTLQRSFDESGVGVQKRRALSPSLVSLPTFRDPVAAHEAEGSDETILDRFKRGSDDGTWLSQAGPQRSAELASTSSASPQSSSHRTVGNRLLQNGDPHPHDSGGAASDASLDKCAGTHPGADLAVRNKSEAKDEPASAAPRLETNAAISGGRLRDGKQSPRALHDQVGKGLPSAAASTVVEDVHGELTCPAAGGQDRAAKRSLPPVGGSHSRDYSRQSRMSRASTVGTLNTVGTNATEGSFGLSGSVRNRLTKSLLPGNSVRRPKLVGAASSSQGRPFQPPKRLGRSWTDTVTSKAATETGTLSSVRKACDGQSERSPSLGSAGRSRTPRDRNLSADSGLKSSVRHYPKHGSSGGVPSGGVGTSGGGTRWVGRSFEIGHRVLEVLEERRVAIAQRDPCQHMGGHRAASKAHDRGIMKNAPAEADEGSSSTDRTDDTLGRSPSAVISLMAAEAQDAAQERNATIVDNPDPNQTPSAAPAPAPAQRKGEAQESHVSKSARANASGQAVAAAGTASLASEAGPLRPSRPFDGARTGRVTPDAERLAPPLLRQRTSSLGTESGTEAASFYSDARVGSQDSGPARAMTQAQALTHPDPPMEAEDRFPEVTHALLRRKSDIVTATGVDSRDAASDHAVAVQPTGSLHELSPLAEGPASAAETDADGGEAEFPDFMQSEISSQVDRSLRPVSAQTVSAGVATSHGSSSAGSTRHLLAPQRASSRQPWLFPSQMLAQPQSQENDAIPSRKKTVQFASMKRTFTSSLFTPKAQDDTAVELGALQPTRNGSGDTAPAPPELVLARPNLASSSPPVEHLPDRPQPAGSVRFQPDDGLITRKSVLKKDRMLVKLAWTAHEDLPRDLDERSARKYVIRDEAWREYVVVFRMGKLELWGDASLSSKALGRGDRLKLRHTILLSRGSTFLSLYSPIDRIFCLTHQPWKTAHLHHHIKRLPLRRQGTDIVLFDCRAQSVASDWVWELWRELGGNIPESIEIHLAAAGFKVRIPVPDEVTPEQIGYIASEAGRSVAGRKDQSVDLADQKGEGYKIINRDNIVTMLWKLARNIPDWKELMDHVERSGTRIELAWRAGNVLSWVRHDRCVDGQTRPWAVLCDSILRQYRAPVILELRQAVHYPTSVRLAEGSIMNEPPAIEGFLWRLKAVSGALTRFYLTTHDGHLFICRPSKAQLPDNYLYDELQNAKKRHASTAMARSQTHQPEKHATGRRSAAYKALARFLGREKIVLQEESLAALRQQVSDALAYPAETKEDLEAQIEAYKSFERRRQFEQICNSDGYVDLRSIWMIRSISKGPVRCPGKDDVKPSGPRGGAAALRRVYAEQEAAPRDGEESEPASDADDDDVGGEEGLSGPDRGEVRASRQIEIVMANGRSIRLEAYSRSVAREWIERISELVKYWRRREKADALDMMNASGFDTVAYNKKLQGKGPIDAHRLAPSEHALSAVLGNIWHWCAIEGCRGIVKCGRLFQKRSNYGPFQNRYYLLIAGRLLSFKQVTSQRTARSRQNAGIFHRRLERVIHLRDAYVYSGKLSEDMLQNGRSEAAQAIGGVSGGGSNSGTRHWTPRVYDDGLFSFDEDEDCTLVIRYRPERFNTPAAPPVPDLSVSAPVAAASLRSNPVRPAPNGDNNKEASDATALATAAASAAAAPPQPQPQPPAPPAGFSRLVEAAGGRPCTAANPIPKLDDKMHKYIALRARNKLERDQWVRCITNEIEKIVRGDCEREERLKNTGRVDF